MANNITLKTRLMFAGSIFLIIVCIVSAGLYARRTADYSPISSISDTELDIPVKKHRPYYLQDDPRWDNDLIGGSKEPLSAVGCTICSVSMAAEILGYNISPGQLNARLIEANGYTSRGWLIWTKVSSVTEGKIKIRVPSQLTHSEIDKALEAGSIPVVKFYLSNGAAHWVPIVGKLGKEYLIKDPLDPDRKIVPLSEKTHTIVSVRYVERQ